MGGLFRDAFAESAGSAGCQPGGLFTEAKRSLSLLGHLGLLGGGRADFAGKRSLRLLGLLGGGRADIAGKRSLRLLGLLGGSRADFSGKRSLRLLGWFAGSAVRRPGGLGKRSQSLLGLLGLLGGGRADFAGKRLLSLLGLLHLDLSGSVESGRPVAVYQQ